MKLKFNKKYLSIEKFNDVTLEDFSVLTGLNGSGKTQLLQAISEGNVSIDEIDHTETIYFNYQEFVVTDNPTQNQEALSKAQNRIGKVITLREELYYATLSAIDEFVRENSLKGGFSIHATTLINAMRSKDFQFDKYYPKKDFDTYSTIRNEIKSAGQLARVQKVFTKHFVHLLNNYLHNKNNYPESTVEFISYGDFRNLYSRILKNLEAIVAKHEPNLFYYFKNNFPNKSPLEVENSDFNTIHIALSQIIEEEKKFLFDEANRKLLLYDLSEGKLDKESIEEQLEVYGTPLSPFKVLNEVLNEFDCNGYQIDLSEHRVKVGMTQENVQLKVRLIHKIHKHVISFSQLSSGEKTLMALVFLLFQTKRNKHLPKLLLLDEIDSSLHPTSIKRLLDVIQNVFIKKYGMKVILATHSPTTIALAPEDSMFIIHKQGLNKIVKESKNEAINKLTEGIATLDSGLKLLDSIDDYDVCIISEGNNSSYLKAANKIYGNDKIIVIDSIKDISGSGQLKTLYKFLTRISHKAKIFCVWDCDAENSIRELKESGNTYPFVFKRNEKNKKVKKGIENLFEETLFTDQFYIERVNDEGGISTNLDKKGFENFIISSLNVDYGNFKPLFDLINQKNILKEPITL